MALEQSQSKEENKSSTEAKEASTVEQINTLKDQGAGLHNKLVSRLGTDSIPQMPERLTPNEQAQRRMAEEMGVKGLPEEFERDTDPEFRMTSALQMMKSWEGDQLRITDPNTLHSSPVDEEDHAKTLDQFTDADLTSQNG